MSIQKPFVVRNGIEVNSNLIFGDIVTDRVGIGTTQPTDTLEVIGGIAATTINLSGVGTIPTVFGDTLNYSTGNIVTGVVTSISGSTINYSGIVTGGSYRVGSTEVISSARELKNIVSLDATTTATIESAIANAPNTFTDLNVTGISTLNVVKISSDLNVSGISTVGGVVSSGIITAVDFNSTSDETLKYNVETVDNALDTVSSLRGVKFQWKEDDRVSYGVIAQELQQVLPELVSVGDIKTVNYNGIIGVLIEAVKELKAEIEDLKRNK